MSKIQQPKTQKALDGERTRELDVWETTRYRLVDVASGYGGGPGIRQPPKLKRGDRIASIAAHPMGLLYLIEKRSQPDR